MTSTDPTHRRSPRKALAMELILAFGEGIGLAFGMPERGTAEWN